MSSLYLLNHSVSVQLKLVRNQVLGIMTLDTELAHCDQAHLTDCLFFYMFNLLYAQIQTLPGNFICHLFSVIHSHFFF